MIQFLRLESTYEYHILIIQILNVQGNHILKFITHMKIRISIYHDYFLSLHVKKRYNYTYMDYTTLKCSLNMKLLGNETYKI